MSDLEMFEELIRHSNEFINDAKGIKTQNGWRIELHQKNDIIFVSFGENGNIQ